MCCKDYYYLKPEDKTCFTSKTSATENRRIFKITAKNKAEKFCRIHLDACVIAQQNPVKRCDFIFVRCSNKDVYYVELKGKHIKTAYQQIITTIQQHLSSPKSKNYGFIIASRITVSQTELNKMRTDFAKKYGIRLVIQSQQYTHQI